MFYYEEDYGVQFKFTQPAGNVPMIVTVAYDDGFPGEIMEKEPKKWAPSKEELTMFMGKYHSSHLDYYWNLLLNEQGKIVLKRANMPDTIMEPDGENQFHYIGEKGPGDGFDQWMLFKKDEHGKIRGFTIWSNRVMHHRFEKL